MDASLNRKSLALGVPGLVLQIVGRVISLSEQPGRSAAGLAIMLVGTVLLILGLAWYARAKGHNGWWGLMGLLSLIGLIVLAVLPDQLKNRA